MLQKTTTVRAHRYRPSGIEEVEVQVSAEYHVAFLLNGRPYLTVACSGTDLELLAAGHLASEGIILSENEIERIDIDEKGMTVNVITVRDANIISRLIKVRTLVSGCAGGGGDSVCSLPVLHDLPELKAPVILACAREFLGFSETYRLTHGVHSSALYDMQGKRAAFFDEIGRHNAVDKLIGLALMRGVAVDRMMLFTTGRISSEIVTKAVVAKVPVIVTRAAPTSMAVELVRKLNIILITGVKRDSFYVHHGIEYIS
ncbi:MAG: formate dehydrogenase family accessory protein FdhD [Spirochaetes bacterium RBG_16_49_21]|nr:MAG: formate dehydrogenase family accessory protein FdhD [Spirochaetes bacterium RBG_16_49_21]